jgi:hypothetical protein
VSLSIDQALAELQRIAERLAALPDGHPDRSQLLERRDALREAARAAADLSRNPVALRRELTLLEARLRELEKKKIKRSLMERRRWVNDPSAYAHTINDRIDESSAEDRDTIEERIAVLRARLGELGAHPGG